MDIKCSSNIPDIAKALDEKSKAVKGAIRKGLKAGIEVLFEEDRKQVNAIYARQIPRGGRKNKKLWKRTGRLGRGEKRLMPNSTTAIITNPDTPYAATRHNLRTPGAGNVTRHDPWREKTVQAAQNRAVETFEQTIQEELEKA